MKWLSLVLMTLDHVNKYLLQYRLAALFAMGRSAMPLFAFVLAYNLARPDALAGGALWRTARRLLGYGRAASVPVMALREAHGWWPLNIMFTLLVAACVIGLLGRGGRLGSASAVVVFLVGGALVDYFWFAPALVLVCWRYCRYPTRGRLVVLIAAMAIL
jgi:hypothetical protein